MASLQIEVFLSSRFSEFAELRKAITLKVQQQLGEAFNLKVVDLNDGLARTRPPRDECARRARQSDVMLLLLGHSYGELAPSCDISHTHIEYRAATEPGATTQVLAWMVEDTSAQGGPVIEERMHAFRAEVMRDRTPQFLGGQEPASQQVDRVVQALLNHLVQRKFLNEQPEPHEPEEQDDEDNTPVNARGLFINPKFLDSLELTQRRSATQHAVNTRLASELEACGPISEQAAEQRLLAERALELGDNAAAIQHLKQCLTLVPSQPKAGYELAMLQMSGRVGRQQVLDAADRLRESQRMFDHLELPFWRSAALLGQARAHIILNPADVAPALRLIERANEPPPYLPNFELIPARYEHARMLALAGDPHAAVDAIARLARSRGSILDKARKDPAFLLCKQEINALLNNAMDECVVLSTKLSSHHARLLQLHQFLHGMGYLLEAPPMPPTQTEHKNAGDYQAALNQHMLNMTRWLDKAAQGVASLQSALASDAASNAGADTATFRRKGAALIKDWKVKPDQTLKAGMEIFTFTNANYKGPNPKVDTYCLPDQWQESILLGIKAQRGAEVGFDTPLFTHGKPPKERNLAHRYKVNIAKAEQEIRDAEGVEPALSESEIMGAVAATVIPALLAGFMFSQWWVIVPTACLSALYLYRTRHDRHTDQANHIAKLEQALTQHQAQFAAFNEKVNQTAVDMKLAIEFFEKSLSQASDAVRPIGLRRRSDVGDWVLVHTDEQGNLLNRKANFKGLVAFGPTSPASAGLHMAKVQKIKGDTVELVHLGMAPETSV